MTALPQSPIWRCGGGAHHPGFTGSRHVRKFAVVRHRAGGNLARPSDDEWDAVAPLEDVGLVAAEDGAGVVAQGQQGGEVGLRRAAVVAGHHDQRVLRQAKAVERLRVEVARQRVQSSSEAIERVAETTGFRDPERMRRAFIRAFGQPPQSLRRAARAG